MSSNPKSILELEERSCHAYAKMVNTRNTDFIEELIDDSCVRTSQKSFSDIEGKTSILEHYKRLFQDLERSNVKVYAEIGRVPIPGFGFHFFHSTSAAAADHAQREARSAPMYYRPCCVISVNSLDNVECLVLFEIKEQKLVRIDLCQAIPHPLSAERTRIFPSS